MEARVGTLRRGTLVGAGFGLAVTAVEAWLGAFRVLEPGAGATLITTFYGVFLAVALGALIGALYAQLLLLPGGPRAHVLAVAFTWAAIALYATPPEGRAVRLVSMVGPAAGVPLVALGRRLGRSRPWLPALLGGAAVAAAIAVAEVGGPEQTSAVRAPASEPTAVGAPDHVAATLDSATPIP